MAELLEEYFGWLTLANINSMPTDFVLLNVLPLAENTPMLFTKRIIENVKISFSISFLVPVKFSFHED